MTKVSDKEVVSEVINSPYEVSNHYPDGTLTTKPT